MAAGGALMGCGPPSAAVALRAAPVAGIVDVEAWADGVHVGEDDLSGEADGRLGDDNLADEEGRVVHKIVVAAVRAEEDGDM